jgi:glycosyltransferase involved in cell wall biosynthesis
VKLSINIPCYNSKKFIDRCVRSALDQGYNNYQINIYDNKSTDGTWEHLQEKYSDNKKIKLLSVDNIYPNSYREAFEHAFENNQTDYLTFLASDDYIAPDYVSKIMAVIKHAPDKIKCIQSPIIGIHNNKPVEVIKHEYRNLKQFKQLCLSKSPVTTPSVIYHKSLYKYLLPKCHLDNDLPYNGSEDYDMYCNLADNKIFIWPLPKSFGYYYTWHQGQCTWKNKSADINYDKKIQDYWRETWKM